MTTVKITLPKEDYAIIEFSQNSLVGMATINTALKTFEHKKLFPWYLSLMIIYSDKNEERMPTKPEQELLCNFEETLGKAIQTNGNAVFVASVTQNGYRELIWHVHTPEISNDYLLDLIDSEDYPRPFDFTIEFDEDWNKAQWHFDMLDKTPDYLMPGETG